jgi:hypothetical protein
MRVLLAFAALLVFAAPAEAACRRDPSGPPVTVTKSTRSGADRLTTTRLIACDRRRGRRIVLARGRLRDTQFGLPRGTGVVGYSVAGRRVAWMKAHTGRRSVASRLHVVRVGRRVQRLRAFTISRVQPDLVLPQIDVAITSRGDLAWLAPHVQRNRYRVTLERVGHRAVVVATGDIDTLGIEDDRTLRIRVFERYRYIEIRPLREPRCGAREQFRPIFETATVLVTRATYGKRRQGMSVRVCRRADGRDPVVATVYDEVPSLDVAGADRDWVVLVESRCLNPQCAYVVGAFEAGSGRRGPGARFLWPPDIEDVLIPEPGRLVAVSAGGVAAWVSVVDGVERLVVPRRRRAHVLDSGAPGAIRDLAFAGTRLTWTNDGVPRSAEVP